MEADAVLKITMGHGQQLEPWDWDLRTHRDIQGLLLIEPEIEVSLLLKEGLPNDKVSPFPTRNAVPAEREGGVPVD